MARYPESMPQYEVGHLSRLERIDRLAELESHGSPERPWHSRPDRLDAFRSDDAHRDDRRIAADRQNLAATLRGPGQPGFQGNSVQVNGNGAPGIVSGSIFGDNANGIGGIVYAQTAMYRYGAAFGGSSNLVVPPAP